jgi:aryl-alcohol dehydrogenase-like predicted oxidoreductase
MSLQSSMNCSQTVNQRLAIGTVQFGLPYGIANQQGQVPLGEAKAILDHAKLSGVNTLDTAMTYGESEQSLGEIGVSSWRVVSKLPPVPSNCSSINDWVRESVSSSLARLKISNLTALLLHRSQQLLEPNGSKLYEALQSLKNAGLVQKIGVSIYDPEELDRLCPHFDFDLVQAPLNVIDRRLLTTGWLDRLESMGVEVHLRSIFLQGLLLMPPESRPIKFHRWNALWDVWDQWLLEQQLSAVQACLGFALGHKQADRIIVGVQGLGQWKEIASYAHLETPVVPDSICSGDSDLVNPSMWNAI